MHAACVASSAASQELEHTVATKQTGPFCHVHIISAGTYVGQLLLTAGLRGAIDLWLPLSDASGAATGC